MARNCRERLSCKTCKRNHPSILHEYIKREPKKEENNGEEEAAKFSNAFTTTEKAICCKTKKNIEVISMSILPVVLTHPQATKQSKVYALLDNCSQGMFVAEGILDRMNISGISSRIVVKTLTSEDCENSQLVTGFTVEPLSRECKVKLPNCFSRKNTPDESEGNTNSKQCWTVVTLANCS